jgi:hypothetical protein
MGTIRRAGFCAALRMLAVLALVCTSVLSARADAFESVLAPYENAEWPHYLDGLSLPAGKAYVVLILLPSAYPIDFSDAEAARRSLMRNVRAPMSAAAAKTLIGHSMVAWQCAGRRGLISKTGESKGQATRMILSGGWGITPFLSVFDDGVLLTLDDVPGRYERLIADGRATILAVQVNEASCRSMRKYLARYIAHPRRPESRFGLLLDSGRFEGDGCASFALNVIGEAGLFSGIDRRFRRRLEIYDGALGRRTLIPEGVEPFVSARNGEEEKIVSYSAFRSGPWTGGKLHGVVEFIDPELLYSALVALRMRAGEAAASYRARRALSAGDPVVMRVRTDAVNWAERRFATMRFAGAKRSALVLER